MAVHQRARRSHSHGVMVVVHQFSTDNLFGLDWYRVGFTRDTGFGNTCPTQGDARAAVDQKIMETVHRGTEGCSGWLLFDDDVLRPD